MTIHDPARTLQSLERFLQELQHYKDLIGSHEHYDEAEALRSRMAQNAGAIGPDLDELHIPRQVSWHGQTMPALESALMPVANPDNVVVQGQMLDLSIQAIETAIGRARRLKSDRERDAAAGQTQRTTSKAMENTRAGEPIVFPVPPDEDRISKTGWLGIGLLAGAVCGYMWGRYRDQIWNTSVAALRGSESLRWFVVVLLGAIALVVGGHAVNRASNQTFSEHPVRKTIEIIIAVAAAFASIVLGKM